MAFTVDIDKFRFAAAHGSAFSGRRVLISGSGKDGGLGQALALAAGLNGAEVVGIHFHRSYRDGFDLVLELREKGIKAFAVQTDVTSMNDMWASRGHVVEQMGGRAPNLVICNSGLTESGYRFGRALPIIENESRAERRARVRQTFIDNLEESRLVLDTKIDGFFAMTHLWAGEAIYHEHDIQFLYVSSRQALDPGVAVPGYVIANWAVLQLPKVLRVNLGRAAGKTSACCLLFPFIRTGMTDMYANEPKVYGRWQPRMLETHEAAESVNRLLQHPSDWLNEGIFELHVEGTPDNIDYHWQRVEMTATRVAV
jgi:NAD(P)-dependent dehydrogenase (short-subunit alcohol dehydrogenase family)